MARSKENIKLDLTSGDIVESPISGLYVTRDGKVYGTEETGYYEIYPYLNKPTENWKVKSGYYKFKYNGKMYQLHNILAKTFVPGYKEGLVVNHKDNNSLNNNIENLEWITRGANVAKYWATLTEEEMIEYRIKYSEAVKESHKKGNYNKHLEELHDQLRNKNKGE